MVGLIALALSFNSVAVTPPQKEAINGLPCARVHGIAKEGSRWLVGGLDGLWIGEPGKKWEQINHSAVRQVASQGEDHWVLYGNGSVDKLNIKRDRLYFDVLHETAKRPWAAALAMDGQTALFGGCGGWIEKGTDSFQETYPEQIGETPITALARFGESMALGTQSGLWLVSGEKVQKLSFAQGLPDNWITGLVADGQTLWIGTASGGLCQWNGRALETVKSPSQRIRLMTNWNGRLVLGTLDGCFLRGSSGFEQLTLEETTVLTVIEKRLYVGTPEKLLVVK
ncbi:MAG: hypothetical protein R2688_07045 [Fimbriimonadaceae bacterium]